MTDKELLKAISQLIDDKLKSINERLDIIELKQNKLSSKLEDIQIDIKLLRFYTFFNKKNPI